MAIQHGSKAGPCKGKKFLVTGGSRGIGKAVVEELYAQGATVYALARTPSTLKVLKEELPLVNTICVDVADWNATRKVLENLELMNGLINNAAISIEMSSMSLNPDDFDRLYQTNLKSAINISQVVCKKMIEAGKGGTVVNVSSVAGKKAFPTCIGYSCLKAALQMFSKGMALELAPHNITVNTVCPAAVETDMLKGFLERNETPDGQLMGYLKSRTPTGLAIMPMSDIVNTILFFASNTTSQITGESLKVDGGFVLAF